MTTDRNVLRLAAKFDRELKQGYAEFLEACKADWKAGFRPHYCEHGTNQWTDYDNICGLCEVGFTMSDPLIRRKHALIKAHAAWDDTHAVIEAVATLQRVGLDHCINHKDLWPTLWGRHGIEREVSV